MAKRAVTCALDLLLVVVRLTTENYKLTTSSLSSSTMAPKKNSGTKAPSKPRKKSVKTTDEVPVSGDERMSPVPSTTAASASQPGGSVNTAEGTEDTVPMDVDSKTTAETSSKKTVKAEGSAEKKSRAKNSKEEVS